MQSLLISNRLRHERTIMTVPSLVIITTGPFDGVAWNVVVALMLFTTGEDTSAALA